MTISVVIRSRNEADRLRLVLASLACQSVAPEIVVVDDGSCDHTPEVVAVAAREANVVALRNDIAAGRAGASNAGAAAASGDVLIFLDGDTIAAPGFVAQHAERHRAGSGLIARGETWHVRCTRPFLDPETGTPQPGAGEKIARMPAAEHQRSLVTRQQIAHDFAAIDTRGQPGVYSGAGPRALFACEMDALRNHPECPVLWAAASGSNLSVRRDLFMSVGGFNPALTINEHREVALRLCRAGGRMTATDARSYHLIHRSAWRDPLLEREWETVFFAAHPIAAAALLPILWESLADRPKLPQAARLDSLPALAAAAARCGTGRSAQEFRETHCRLTLQEAG